MKLAQSFLAVSFGIIVSTLVAGARTASMQQVDRKIDLEGALGKWSSTERFEEEPRITVAIRRKATGMYGWMVMLGQTRKSDNRATLALSFADVTWDGRRFLFDTVLPDDEGTIGWELSVATSTTAVLKALTEDGKPFDGDLKWDMRK
jgi:hypothetical protein